MSKLHFIEDALSMDSASLLLYKRWMRSCYHQTTIVPFFLPELFSRTIFLLVQNRLYFCIKIQHGIKELLFCTKIVPNFFVFRNSFFKHAFRTIIITIMKSVEIVNHNNHYIHIEIPRLRQLFYSYSFGELDFICRTKMNFITL